jgi:cell division septation protein DedD
MNTDPGVVPSPAKPQIAPENLIEFAVMGPNGDTKHMWDRTKPVEIDAARELFKKLRKEGYLAYKVVGEKGDKGEMVTEFDPEAGAVIFSPALKGG